MAEIMVTPQILNQKADELDRLNSQFKSQVQELQGSENNVSNMWEGEARDAFHNTFNRDKGYWDQFSSAVREYATTLREDARRYSQTEQKNAQMFRSR